MESIFKRYFEMINSPNKLNLTSRPPKSHRQLIGSIPNSIFDSAEGCQVNCQLVVHLLLLPFVSVLYRYDHMVEIIIFGYQNIETIKNDTETSKSVMASAR